MSENIAVIPKGTKVQIMGCQIILAEDTKVEGNQVSLDDVLRAQYDYHNGIGVTHGEGLKSSAI